MSDVFELVVDLSELTDIRVVIQDKIRRAESEVARMLAAIGMNIHADAVEMISHGPTRHGESYTRGGQGATRSADGEPAKSDTGNLASSVFAVQGKNHLEVGYLESIAPYGKWLEDPSSLNRPVLVPVAQQNKPLIQALIRKAAKNITS